MHRECPSEYTLDLLHVGEASAVQQQDLQEMEACAPCQDRLLARQNTFAQLAEHEGFEAFLSEQWALHEELQEPVTSPGQDTVAVEPAEGLWERWFSWLSWPQGLGLTASGVALLVALHWAPGIWSQPGGKKQGTPKSLQPAFRALFYRQGTTFSRWLRDGQVLKSGDLVQFSYVTPRAYHAMVVGMNERGESYVFVPYQGTRSIRLAPGKGKLPGDSSLELDDYVGLERFFFLFAPRPFTLAQVRGAIKQAFVASGKDLRRLRALQGPWELKTFLIQKRKR